MYRMAFKMKLFPAQEAEYKRRHDQIWPELKSLLKEAGISDYSIFLDPETNTLIAILSVSDPGNLASLRQQTIMQQWWDYMANIMETNSDKSPVSIELKEMFYMP
jgi:L-rhamnose mutarotase